MCLRRWLIVGLPFLLLGCVVTPAPVVAVPPAAPPVLVETVPVPPPGPAYVWVPGYWAWGPRQYVWVPGRYAVPPGSAYVWAPGYWAPAIGGHIWIGGHWRIR
jgi:hypothetical protein